MTYPSMLLLLIPGCIELPEIVERNCDQRQAYYPDEDGDGVGEPTAVFIGCEAPDGWVQQVGTPTADTGLVTESTADTGAG